ncbi:hypothetical protein IFR05_005242 [Cadophora sp. M221]|nr:hypothetical protein IFR05_005242 [Cadophora sp. M221]
MAEILGVISGIVAIADAGFKLYLALSNTASALGSAGDDILLFSSEVRIFAEILVVVRANLKDQSLKTSRSEILDKAIGVIPGLVMQCEMVYASMEVILARLRPCEDSNFRLKSKIMWMRDKSKMLRLRGYLEPLKSSLQLLLTLMKNEMADNNDEPAAIRAILREELKAVFQESMSQPESLDEGSLDIDIEEEQNQLAPFQNALVLRTKPLHTIKEAAETMIAFHKRPVTFDSSPNSTEDSSSSAQTYPPNHADGTAVADSFSLPSASCIICSAEIPSGCCAKAADHHSHSVDGPVPVKEISTGDIDEHDLTQTNEQAESVPDSKSSWRVALAVGTAFLANFGSIIDS